jgi:hypothetical protein
MMDIHSIHFFSVKTVDNSGSWQNYQLQDMS